MRDYEMFVFYSAAASIRFDLIYFHLQKSLILPISTAGITYNLQMTSVHRVHFIFAFFYYFQCKFSFIINIYSFILFLFVDVSFVSYLNYYTIFKFILSKKRGFLVFFLFILIGVCFFAYKSMLSIYRKIGSGDGGSAIILLLFFFLLCQD